MSIQEYVDSIQQSLNKMIQTSESLSEEVIRWKPSEAEWSILQILSHINEAIPYWLGEIIKIIETPGTTWGRGLQDQARLSAVANPDELSVKVILDSLKEQKDHISAVLNTLTEEQLTIESPHINFAKFGNKPVSFIVDHFIDEHLKGHYGQIHRNLSKLKK
ncbi:DinB family protein [Bacillus aquiflavi]|uniref:DinB family protein n=2 Tax=Bacillus aquiflavi TaxID=2672567 RepID=A0A6B3VWW4_9BACI|nr:DinB family protein [Bacillus aquiflavi]NEY81748.1 DinB family protein [Bacillus aquiflavi]UAC50075.1 DinB family protein [Bacillus aquiflavi]